VITVRSFETFTSAASLLHLYIVVIFDGTDYISINGLYMVRYYVIN